MQFMRIIGQTVISLTIAALTGCSAQRVVPLGEIPKVEETDAAKSKQTMYGVASQAKRSGEQVLTSGPEYARTKAILNRLTDGLGAKRDIWPLLVIDGEDTINAAAYNQNTIAVYTGLIRKVPQDDQLASIVAHEVAHILAKHKTDDNRKSKMAWTSTLSTMVGVAASIGAAAAGVSGAGSIGSLAKDATRITGTGLMLKYDRSQEREADEIGLMVMAKAGYDPHAAITIWQNADNVFQSGSSLSFLSTHPSHSDRASNLEEALPYAMRHYEAGMAARSTPVSKKLA